MTTKNTDIYKSFEDLEKIQAQVEGFKNVMNGIIRFWDTIDKLSILKSTESTLVGFKPTSGFNIAKNKSKVI